MVVKYLYRPTVFIAIYQTALIATVIISFHYRRDFKSPFTVTSVIICSCKWLRGLREKNQTIDSTVYRHCTADAILLFVNRHAPRNSFMLVSRLLDDNLVFYIFVTFFHNNLILFLFLKNCLIFWLCLCVGFACVLC